MNRNLALTFAAAVLVAGCASHPSGPMATAALAPTANQTAKGTVHFAERADGSVDVDVDLTNVPPGVHGFHVHDKGDCGDNGNAAGGPLNPAGARHGAPTATPPHPGALGHGTAHAPGN